MRKIVKQVIGYTHMNLLIFLVPACINCKYYKSYLKPRAYDDLAKCTHNATLYAEMARVDESKCGISARWFEPKN